MRCEEWGLSQLIFFCRTLEEKLTCKIWTVKSCPFCVTSDTIVCIVTVTNHDVIWHTLCVSNASALTCPRYNTLIYFAKSEKNLKSLVSSLYECNVRHDGNHHMYILWCKEDQIDHVWLPMCCFSHLVRNEWGLLVVWGILQFNKMSSGPMMTS